MQPLPDPAVPRGAAGIRIMVAAAAARGVAVDVALAGTGITARDLDDDAALVRVEQEYDVVRNLVGALGDRAGTGVLLAEGTTIGKLGPAGFMVLTSATVGGAVDGAIRGAALWPTILRFSLEQDAAHAYLVADDAHVPADLRATVVERDLAGLIFALRSAQVDLRPDRIEITSPAAHARALAAAYGLPADAVLPDRPRTVLIGRREVLDTVPPQADPTTARLLAEQSERLLAERLARVGVAGQVRALLLHAPGRMPAMSTVAAQLHADPRTLRRRLAAEGTSFRELVDTVQRHRARELLAAGESVETIAARLGYAETAAFTRAFTRREGVPPSRFRAGRR